MKFKTSGLAKSETALVKRIGGLLDRSNVSLFPRARRLHFIGREKSGKQEALGFMVDSFTTLFPQDSRPGTWNALGRLETGDSDLP